MTVTVMLEPAGRCRWDEPVHITVRGLAPGQPVTLRASLRDEKGALFRAHARYCADAAGLLDLERAPALGGIAHVPPKYSVFSAPHSQAAY